MREEAAAAAVLRGAYAVISLDARDAAEQIARRAGELAATEPAPPDTDLFGGESRAARRVLKQLARAARTSMPVLLTGETGTGKEVCARLIHSWSSRAKRRFVPINCAAIPNELMEAELFGYAKGAFSGAVARYEGRLMAAEGGTVFLDEIDDTPLATQVKLLRVLEDRVVSRLGENEWHRVDFRIIAASNRDLKALIAAGTFGADLYERLAILSINLPPLRERLVDLPALVSHFIERFYREEAGMPRPHVQSASPEAIMALTAYAWPGNVRELRNVLFQALVEKRAGEEILLSDLPARILHQGGESKDEGDIGDMGDMGDIVQRAAIARRIDAGTMNLRRAIEALERAALAEALSRTRGNAAKAAKLLGEVGRGASSDPGGTVRAIARRVGVRLATTPIKE